MTENNQPQTIADLLADVDDSAPHEDLDAIRAALFKADKSEGGLANVLHSLFFHTNARLDPDGDEGSAYREMPLNQIVTLADWYLTQRDEDLEVFGPRISPDGIDRVALAAFVDYRLTQDLLRDLFQRARVALNLPLKPSDDLRPDQREALKSKIHELMAADEDGPRLRAFMAAEQIADAVIKTADRHEAEQAAGVINLADRR